MVSLIFVISLICSLMMFSWTLYERVVMFPLLGCLNAESSIDWITAFQRRNTLLKSPLQWLELMSSFAVMITILFQPGHEGADRFFILNGTAFFLLILILVVQLMFFRSEFNKWKNNRTEDRLKTLNGTLMVVLLSYFIRFALILLSLFQN